MKPRVAAEYLVCAFSGQHDFVLLCHFGAEIEQRRVNISHTGQVMRIYGFVKQVCLCVAAAWWSVCRNSTILFANGRSIDGWKLFA